MGEINIPDHEQRALFMLDMSAVDRAIDKAVSTQRISVLHDLALRSCGPFVATKLASFERALRDHGLAKAYQKRERTGESLRRAASDLSFAVSTMKRRVEKHQEERRLFEIEDQISPPFYPSKSLDVRVHYRWRKSINDSWESGHITFIHIVKERFPYGSPEQKRKPSAAKREQALQERFFQEWKYLKSGALESVQEFFRGGQNGSKIPEIFQVTTDHLGNMNNYSTRFWSQEPSSE